MWIGEFDFDNLEFADKGSVYRFPLDNHCQQICARTGHVQCSESTKCAVIACVLLVLAYLLPVLACVLTVSQICTPDCNVEGVEFIDDVRFIVASDKAKRNQDHACVAHDQSAHIFALP